MTLKRNYDKQSEILSHRFISRGYSQSWIQLVFDKVERIQLNNKQRGEKETFSVNYILTYTKKSNQIKSIVNKYWFILTSNPLLKYIFFKMRKKAYIQYKVVSHVWIVHHVLLYCNVRILYVFPHQKCIRLNNS